MCVGVGVVFSCGLCVFVCMDVVVGRVCIVSVSVCSCLCFACKLETCFFFFWSGFCLCVVL